MSKQSIAEATARIVSAGMKAEAEENEYQSQANKFLYDPGTFANFCGEYGYDEDSRRADVQNSREGVETNSRVFQHGRDRSIAGGAIMKYLIGYTYRRRANYEPVRTVVDFLTTTNHAGEVVETFYVVRFSVIQECSHLERVTETEIDKGLKIESQAKETTQ